MYDEKSDFLHHKKEVDDFFESFSNLAIALGRGMKILDLGGGQGMHAGLLTRQFENVYCSDVIDYTSLYGGEFPKLLYEKYERNGYDLCLEYVQFIKSDGMDLIFKDRFFDIVLSFNSFEHIPDPGRALAEMIRCTKSGGFIYIQFDPIWTADTGSHFFHRVPEPWAHLVYSDKDFTDKMALNGAPPDEISEYEFAMNRLRLGKYWELFYAVGARDIAKIVYSGSWSGVVDEKHKKHNNLRILKSKGYTEEELLLRGMRFILRRL